MPVATDVPSHDKKEPLRLRKVVKKAPAGSIRLVLYVLQGASILASGVLFGYSFAVNKRDDVLPSLDHWMPLDDAPHHSIHQQRLRRRSPPKTHRHDSIGPSDYESQKWSSVPDDWETYSFYDVRNHFSCNPHSYDQTKSIPTLQYWIFLQKQYKQHVDEAVEFDDPVPPTQGYSLEPDEMEPPPYYAKHSEGKGRGLFASHPIEEGELVHNGNQSDLVFPGPMAWRRFVFSLPRKMACDITDWVWTQNLHTDTDSKMHIILGPNISTLMNSGEDPNIAPLSKTDVKMYATRRIEKDEEILYDYSVYETNWKLVGLL